MLLFLFFTSCFITFCSVGIHTTTIHPSIHSCIHPSIHSLMHAPITQAQLIAQSISQAFQVAYVEFLKANGINDPDLIKVTTLFSRHHHSMSHHFITTTIPPPPSFHHHHHSTTTTTTTTAPRWTTRTC